MANSLEVYGESKYVNAKVLSVKQLVLEVSFNVLTVYYSNSKVDCFPQVVYITPSQVCS